MKKPDPMILRPAASALLGISTPTAKRWESTDPEFPKPIYLGPTRVAYRVSEITRFQNVLIKRSAERQKQRPAIADRAATSGVLSGATRRAKRDARLAEQRAAAEATPPARATRKKAATPRTSVNDAAAVE